MKFMEPPKFVIIAIKNPIFFLSSIFKYSLFKLVLRQKMNICMLYHNKIVEKKLNLNNSNFLFI